MTQTLKTSGFTHMKAFSLTPRLIIEVSVLLKACSNYFKEDSFAPFHLGASLMVSAVNTCVQSVQGLSVLWPDVISHCLLAYDHIRT